jgi:hypothetical protein
MRLWATDFGGGCLDQGGDLEEACLSAVLGHNIELSCLVGFRSIGRDAFCRCTGLYGRVEVGGRF